MVICTICYRVLDRLFQDRQLCWRRCLTFLGKTVMQTIATATLSAECRILGTSGLSTHPIHGHVHFSSKVAFSFTAAAAAAAPPTTTTSNTTTTTNTTTNTTLSKEDKRKPSCHLSSLPTTEKE